MYGTQFCEMGRKLLLTGVLIVFLNDRSTAYALCAFCVSFSALLLHTLVQPYVYAKKKDCLGTREVRCCGIHKAVLIGTVSTRA